MKIIALGLCLGFFLVILCKIFQIKTDVFLRWYWVAAPAAVLGAVLCNLLYVFIYQRRIRQAVRLLDEGKTLEYIARIERLLKTGRWQSLRNVLELDLAVGYLELKEYKRALPMLEALSGRKLAGSALRAAHRLDLCLAYFQSGQGERGAALYHESQALFDKFRDKPLYGAAVAAVDALMAIQDGQPDRAREILTRAQGRYPKPRDQKSFREILELL